MKHVIVVGNGMVGYKFCEKIRSKAQAEEVKLTVFGEEVRPAYDRVHLSEFFSGKSADEMLMAPSAWYEENDITLHTSELIVSIDKEAKTITTHKGDSYSYDVLVLATGSAAFVPPIKGVDKKGVFVYRTIEDLIAIEDYAKNVESAAVMGGGLLGLEAAKALIDLGKKTSVIEFAPRLMPRQLDESGSNLLKSKIEALDIEVLCSKATKEIKGNGKLDGLQFQEDQFYPVDMLVISAGIRPRDELAKKAGLSVGERGGIIVGDTMQTSDPSIYAIGECALHENMIYGLVAPGYDMADVAVSNILEALDSRAFTGFDMSTKLKLIGIEVASFGNPFTSDEEAEAIVYENKRKGIYKRINVSKDGQKLLGGILVGDASDYGMLHQLYLNWMKLPPEPEDLILGARGGEKAVSAGVENLPDEACICSCENVSKKLIVDSIKVDDLTEINQVKAATKACTGCGGCTPMVNDLLKHTLKSQGKAVKNSLCEHFDYSRQELFDLIKVKGYKSYDELLDNHGSGHGCEICKPVVASILASIYAETANVQNTIQDTNDRFLANIQRGGTYSVVPRIPAGEITPDKLAVIAHVAKKYDLYTKITGGQRIDLFGARLDQLPMIWEELIEAGFESGHAYGKALRTVKSCVGSTWCRYGVQDSVSFAIQVEERYKGIRAPHKLKSAVSGCIRECAEAQSKDFGIIATEKGWNLYVCGNGGAKPQHAQLLAADVSTEMCIKLIDRFLMFYIRTAEPLTRTATWLNKLEGGMDYLKEVVVDDSLGICDELEKEMQQLVDGYECEWKGAVEDPKVRARFSHFINSSEQDSTLVFDEFRGQKKPADW